MKALILATLLSFSFSAFAQDSLEGFKKRFRVIRDEEGRALRIIDRSLHTRFGFKSFSSTYNSWFIGERTGLLEGATFLSPDAEIESRTLSRELENILEEVRTFNLTALIASSGFDKIDEFLIGEFKKVSTVGFRTVSNLENTTFFYQDKHYRKIEEATKKQVKKFFPSERDEEVVGYLVQRYIGYLRDSRTYHQSILLHYLTAYPAGQLNLAEAEVGMAISSILEGEIKWHDIFSRRRLKKKWQTYGLNKLKEVTKESMDRVVEYRDLYAHTPYFANAYFAKTQMKTGEEVWINAFYQSKALDNSPTLSYDYSRPDFVYKKRRYFELLLFAAIQGKGPNRIKKYFTHLQYRRQMLKEGMLFGFYEAKGDEKMMRQLIRQSLNPLETIFKIPQ